MAREYRWERRERRKQRERQRMPISGRSVFLIVEQQVKRAEQIRKEREEQKK